MSSRMGLSRLITQELTESLTPLFSTGNVGHNDGFSNMFPTIRITVAVRTLIGWDLSHDNE